MCCSGLFVSFDTLKLKPVKLAPALIALGAILFVCLVRLARVDYFEGLERGTYDLRAREALKFSPPVATNLGFVFIDEGSLKAVYDGSVGLYFGLLWPRQVYGRLVNELTAQGARAVALDVILGELRPDQPPVSMANGNLIDSDEFFAESMKRSSNVILAASTDILMPQLFFTNAPFLGDVLTEKDRPEGVLRRVKAFRSYQDWHWLFRKVAADTNYTIDLSGARIEPRQIVLSQSDGQEIKVPLDEAGTFDLTDFLGDKLPPGMARRAKPFKDIRIWHMGIEMAARELGLDLNHAQVDLAAGRITLRGAGGIERVIPVDRDGYFYIDWSIPPSDTRLQQAPIQALLYQNYCRLKGETNQLTDDWRGKLVVVGSAAVVGNNLSDRGATSISPDTLLASKHWNVANSLIVNRFVQRSSVTIDLCIIVVMGLMAAWLTWFPRIIAATVSVLMLIAGYIFLTFAVYVHNRYWMPIILPVLGAMLLTYVCLVVWRVLFEQAQQRRVKSIFSTVVATPVMNELLKADDLSLEGARREITVMFADVRGFTQLTDVTQERANEYVRQQRLVGDAAEALYDAQAREVLATVNVYLGLIADVIMDQKGVLDKFIGDCVMAFWGAPLPDDRHAVACVKAAIAAQRAMYALNQERALENKKLELENLARVAAGQQPKDLYPLLLLGTGINTGIVNVGLMGSRRNQKNYTVFGREVNLASRLESASGRGRIFIGQRTYEHLLRDDAELAATCISRPDEKPKGFAKPVKVYEVPWRPAGSPSLEEEFLPQAPTDATTFTGFVQREGK